MKVEIKYKDLQKLIDYAEEAINNDITLDSTDKREAYIWLNDIQEHLIHITKNLSDNSYN